MKLTNIYNKLKALCLAALPVAGIGGGLLCSCNDFLTIQPTNDIVLENFWTEEADVYSVLNSCYAQLESQKCIERMIIWGEARSDNMTTGAGAGTDLMNVFKENILETTSYSDWQCFYEVINRCNTVLYYSPHVRDIDPNFTHSEWLATVAEAKTLRALCYFYLIRTFRDVPFITYPSNDDTQEYIVPASPFSQVLDNIIDDVESVKDDAVRSYGEESVENKCRITRWACYSLLADMYLWKGDYNKVVEYCDLVINHKIKEYEELYEKNPTTIEMELYGKYPLISEAMNSNNAGTTYTRIFGDGNSFESIFELNFVRNQSVSNSAIANLYGSSTRQTGQICAPSFLYDDATNDNDYFKKTDCRFLENMFTENNKVYISKYVNQSVSFRVSSNSSSTPTVTRQSRSDATANWIIYRLTDVMLMRAEAEVMLAGDDPEDAEGLQPTITEEQEKHFRKAFECVSAVWKRANNKRVASSDTLVYNDYASSKFTMEKLVLEERQRELMFEGKRWYDLVRSALRQNDNSQLIGSVIPKFQENQSGIRIKLSTRDILFWPYAQEELKQNKYLIQNTAYITDQTEKN